ncbi:MAG: CheY-like chemotaxis protein [Planctomycetota bacterium]
MEIKEFDVLALDYMMPDTNGVELCRILRAGERHKSVPIVMLSFVAEKGAGAIEAGVDVVLRKAIRHSIPLQSLCSVLDRGLTGDFPPPVDELPRFDGRVLLVEDNIINASR